MSILSLKFSKFYERFPPRKQQGYFLTEKAYPPLRNIATFPKKLTQKTIILTGGHILPLSIFFIFKYDNKQLSFFPKMCLKVASAY